MKNVKTKLIYRTGRKFHNVSSCEDTHKLFFRHKALAAPSIDKMEEQMPWRNLGKKTGCEM